MSTKIRGITIEIGGDTTGLEKSLGDVNKEIRSTQSQLKDVERLLKLDPKNTELLSQKQKLLTEAVEETKKKLDVLKQSEKEVQEQFAQGKVTQKQYDALKREIEATEKSLKSLEKQAEQSNLTIQRIEQAGEAMKNFGSKATEAGKALMPLSAAVTAVGTAAIKTTADFDAAMSQVAAVSGATGEDFDALREKAREMGEKTKFSASEAAEAMNYMAMAGWKTEDMLSGIEGIMNLAAASGEDLATTSDIVTDALTSFGLSAEDSGRFADILAASSSNANTNVYMLGESFKYVAPLAGSLGYSAEDVSVALGMMANAGIKASQGGTALRAIITRLVKPTKDSQTAINKLGISISNSDGSMKSFAEVMTDLRKSFSKLTKDEKAYYAAQLAGQEAMSGLLSIVNASETDFDKLTNAVNNCSGTTLEMAETMQDNLSGQLTILQSQLQEAAISIGDAMMPKIRELITKVQELMDWFNGLSDSNKQLVATIGLVVAAAGPALIMIGQISTGIGALMSSLSLLGPAIMALGVSGGPILLTAAAFGLMIEAMSNSKDEADLYAEALGELTPEQQANKAVVDNLYDSYCNLESQRQGTIDSIRNQANMEQLLWQELQSIADENGNVKEGYEDRARVITGQLSEALGIEMEMTGKQIQKYKELCENIDELIEKKQADALLEAKKEDYIEALSKQVDTYMSYNQAKKDVEETTWQMLKAQEEEIKASQEIERLWQENIKTGIDVTNESAKWAQKQQESAAVVEELSEKLVGLNQTYAEAQDAYVGYNTTVSNYKYLYEAVKNDQEMVGEAVLRMMNRFQTAEDGTRETLARQVKDFQEKYQEMQAAVDAGAPGITDSQVKNMARLVELSSAELDKLPSVADQAISNTESSFSKAKTEFEQAGSDSASGYALGIQEGTSKVVNAVSDMANASTDTAKKELDIHSPSKVMMKIGTYVGEGLGKGIKDSSKEVLDAVSETTGQLIEETEEKLSQERFETIGREIATGLRIGIASGKSNVLDEVRRLCGETIKTAKEELGIHSPSTEFAYMGEMSGEGFAAGWTNTIPKVVETIHTTLSETFSKTAECFGEVNIALATLRDSSGNVIATMVENAKQAQEALGEIRSGLEETISGQLSVFDEFDDKAEMSTTELLDNMQSQVEGTEKWAENLKILAERGIDQGLLQKMAEMGPKGAGYATTFVSMTDEQLQKANELFARSMTLPETTTASIMESYRIAGQMTAQGFTSGIEEEKAGVEEASGAMANSAFEMLRETLEIHSPSEATKSLGRYFSEGFAVGITEETAQVTSAVQTVTNAATTALQTNLATSQSTVSSYEAVIAQEWTTWAAGLVKTVQTSLSQINTSWTAGMTKISKETALHLDKTSKTVKEKTQQMKTDTVLAMGELVNESGKKLEEFEPTIRRGFEPGIQYISSLVDDARTWGNHMMQGLIQGLEDYLDELEEVCEDIADTISDNLHFTRPERGSLRNYEEWMPHFMQGLAKGIADNRYLVSDQIQRLADDMSVLQNRETPKSIINFSNHSILMLDGKQLAETMDAYLGEEYG